MSISPQSEARVLERYPYYNVEKPKSRFTLGLDAAENTHCIKKKVQINVVRNWILYGNVCKCICLSAPGVELGGLKDWYSWNIILYWNGKLQSI